ncbi:MAG: HDIG domain-containing protein [Spirochaetaceae bacterium]|nr:HDIG domain-containing protein [Spirochaetaceae bacterium]
MNPNKTFTGTLRAALLSAFPADRRGDRSLSFAVAALFGVGLLLVLFLGPGAAISRNALDEIEVGRVAERDIVADRELSFVDDRATSLRLEAEERLVLPIYVVDEKVGAAAIERFRVFQDLLTSLAAKKYAEDSLYLKVQSEFPGLLDKESVVALARFPLRAQAFSHADAVLRRVLERGVAAPPSTGLERYNPDYVELRRWRDGRLEYEEIPAGRLSTLKSAGAALEDEIAARRLSRPLSTFVAELARSFLVENAFFDADQSARRLESVKKRVDPVVRTIARGERLVRKGFIISESDYSKLAAAKAAVARADWGRIAGDAGFYMVVFALALLLLGPAVSGAALKKGEVLLAALGALLYLLAALAIHRYAGLARAIDLALLLPTALFAMLFAIIAGQRFALLYGLVLSLLCLLASGFDARPFALSFLAAAAGAFAVRQAGSRIELVRAGALLALLEAGAAALLAAPDAHRAVEVLAPAALGGVNGFLCGVLTLGFLPVIEQALNAPTRFRLMELSDLNAPILKRLLTVAPGTYSHSVTVAHLAESACREIGADPLLARVGAYYHDIGKIEQPEYFVENQSGYNKHDELNPRLSATVIRSHVKLGVEKARALGLPEEVVDIVAQHHGNGLITWFFHQASKEEAEAKAEDFSYPGQPPSGREAAVVMLADTVEAATRTLKKPTLARLDQAIKDLVMDKVKQGQLDRSDLTFRDLETIRNTFARILAGHFHSRIEYPKLVREARDERS